MADEGEMVESAPQARLVAKAEWETPSTLPMEATADLAVAEGLEVPVRVEQVGRVTALFGVAPNQSN